MSTLALGTLSLLNDMADENPAPQEKWFKRCHFDPMHLMDELRAAARAGLIELDTTGSSKEDYRFRFTAKGRLRLAEAAAKTRA